MQVIAALGGPPPIRNRFPAWWRGSKDRNCFTDGTRYFDHAKGRGGDEVTLVSEANGCDVKAALTWLEAQGFRGRQKLNGAELARAKREAVARAKRADDVQLFHWALDRVLDRQKLEAGRRDDVESLERAATQQYRLMCDPVAEFEAMERSNSTELLRLIEEGREDRHHAARVTAAVVAMLAGRETARNAA